MAVDRRARRAPRRPPRAPRPHPARHAARWRSSVWTLLAASFAQDPVLSHEDSKKLLLFALFYVGVEALGRPAGRERVLASVLLGGLALAGLMVAQHLFLGYDRLDRRPSGFLGHYMSASGVTMAVFLLAVARLALGPRARPRLADLRLPAAVLAGVAVVAAAALAGQGVVATRLCVAALAALAAAVALSDRDGGAGRGGRAAAGHRAAVRLGARRLADPQRLGRRGGGAGGDRRPARAAPPLARRARRRRPSSSCGPRASPPA